MRTYILALSKYAMTAGMLLYTVLAFIQMRRTGKKKSNAADAVMIFLLFVVHSAAFLTIYAATMDPRYVFFWLFQTVTMAAAIVLFGTIYPQSNKTLYINVCMLLSIGLIIITRLPYEKAVRQYVIASVGLFLGIAIPALMKKVRYLKNLTYIYAATGAAALLVVLLLGQVTQGSKLSYSVFGVSMQPSEFVKILFIFYLASAYYESADLRQVFITGVISAAHVIILVMSNDLGTALVFFVAYVFMTFLASGRWQYLLAGAAIGLAGSYVGYHLFSHVQVRVQAWRDPWSVIDSMGYQITQSLFSISNGGLFGAGLMQGTPDKIPYAASDFIFAAICEEMGLIFAFSMIALCLVCFLDILWISLNFADRFYRFTAFGFAVVYIFQIFLTVGGEIKFIPLTGVTLPLVSYGGSSVLSTIIQFAIIEAIYIMQQDRIKSFEDRFEREERERRRRARERRGMADHEKTGRIRQLREQVKRSEYTEDRYDRYDTPEIRKKAAPKSSGYKETEFIDDRTNACRTEDETTNEDAYETGGWDPELDDIDLNDYKEINYDPGNDGQKEHHGK